MMGNTLSNQAILALETSCDETAAALIRGGRTIVANVVASQMDQHQRYGGVVPEVASRQHILSLTPVLQQTLAALDHGWDEIGAIAATYGPGLSGALLTGLNAAKAIAWQRGLPFVGVNHLEAHIYANWLITESETPPPQFPLVALIVSGGHTLLVLLRDHGNYELLGQTRDDAAGEAFDKVARLLELGYPGGPAIEQVAREVSTAEKLPRAWLRNTYDFSFSGLKTAVLHKLQQPQLTDLSTVVSRRKRGRKESDNEDGNATTERALPPPPPVLSTAELAFAFQESVVDVLVTKTIRAAREFAATEILLAGGVAANLRLRDQFSEQTDIPVRYPPIWLCTDNAAMVGAAAYYRFQAGAQSGWDLDVVPNLRLA